MIFSGDMAAPCASRCATSSPRPPHKPWPTTSSSGGLPGFLWGVVEKAAVTVANVYTYGAGGIAYKAIKGKITNADERRKLIEDKAALEAFVAQASICDLQTFYRSELPQMFSRWSDHRAARWHPSRPAVAFQPLEITRGDEGLIRLVLSTVWAEEVSPRGPALAYGALVGLAFGSYGPHAYYRCLAGWDVTSWDHTRREVDACIACLKREQASFQRCLSAEQSLAAGYSAPSAITTTTADETVSTSLWQSPWFIGGVATVGSFLALGAARKLRRYRQERHASRKRTP